LKFVLLTRRASVLILILSLSVFASASDKKDKADSSQKVDSGSFGVFVKGQRAATETFTIQQQNGLSIIKSQLKQTAGPGVDAVTQNSTLQITGAGDLIQYDWSQSSGGSLTVLPKNDFLIEKVTPPGATKAAEKQFLLPSSSSVLDNNFFVHREVLVWRYLAAECKPDTGNLKCEQGPTPFGVLVPQDQASMPIKLQLIGKEKVTIRGAERELLRVNLIGEDFQWALWVDDRDQFKLIQVSIPADSIEVVRD
jgi:hypothetical protein